MLGLNEDQKKNNLLHFEDKESDKLLCKADKESTVYSNITCLYKLSIHLKRFGKEQFVNTRRTEKAPATPSRVKKPTTNG